MAGPRGLAILAFVVLASIADVPELVVASVYDGRPRPAGYPDTPSEEYGPTPPCLFNGVAVKCQWYGFIHIDYLNTPEGTFCMPYTRSVLANTTRFPPGTVAPYIYWSLRSQIFNKTTNDSYCNYGCFDMGASGPVGSPAPTPPTTFPPITLTTPPPSTLLIPPPPATLFTPPPSTLEASPPSTLSTPPPDTTAVAPPPPSNQRLINLNGAGFLQPTGLVSFMISGALLILHGVLGF
ncbi:hypothetical protein KC19_6G156100 [Ceratodon purpureus]|uniref:Uncharacterized protein n=1 Tax=Ceratodon purpureus TaxID=3225 RepID=A0A8T0HIB5_CERPU|nr:hypothetical protein KC19_6G156100 [Ceratodon purpureus]